MKHLRFFEEVDSTPKEEKEWKENIQSIVSEFSIPVEIDTIDEKITVDPVLIVDIKDIDDSKRSEGIIQLGPDIGTYLKIMTWVEDDRRILSIYKKLCIINEDGISSIIRMLKKMSTYLAISDQAMNEISKILYSKLLDNQNPMDKNFPVLGPSV